MKKKFLRSISLLMVLGLLILTIPIKAYEPIDWEEEENEMTVRKPKAELCQRCLSHYNTTCEGEGNGCDVTPCPYE
jgi:hypothetical protein